MHKNIKFGGTKIVKYKSHQHNYPILINDLDINKIVVSNKVSFGRNGFKYFIGSKDGKKVRSLCILLPKLVHVEGTFMKLNNTCLF